MKMEFVIHLICFMLGMIIGVSIFNLLTPHIVSLYERVEERRKERNRQGCRPIEDNRDDIYDGNDF